MVGISRSFLPVKSDIVFRLLFADERNTEFLIGFLQSVLLLPDDDYEDIEILDPHLLREFDSDKLGIVDVKVKTKSGKIIHTEIQLSLPVEMKERISYYIAKLVTEQLGIGDDYSQLKRVVSIIITDNNLIVGDRYHHRFRMYDATAGIEFSDLIEINTLELNKLTAGADGSNLYKWARFIAAETEEELEMAAEMNPQIARAVVRLRELSADEKARDLYERREKARRDENSRLRGAEQKGKRDLLLAMIKSNLSILDIARYTGLSVDEVVQLTKEASK